MTLHFINIFRQASNCSVCKSVAADSRKMCHDHLLMAKVKWQLWRNRRVREGLCISCDNSTHDGQRCPRHIKINRARCKAWMAVPDNKEWRALYDLYTKNTAISLGLCRYCRKRKQRPDTGQRLKFVCKRCARSRQGRG